MRRVDKNPFVCGGLDPAAGGTPTGKDQWMNAIAINHRELEVTMIRRGPYLFPHSRFIHRFNLEGVCRKKQQYDKRQRHLTHWPRSNARVVALSMNDPSASRLETTLHGRRVNMVAADQPPPPPRAI